MSKKKKIEVITIQVPLPKKWELDFEKVYALHERACKLNNADYDLPSFFTGFLLGFGLAEDEEKAEMFFERKEEEDD